MTKVGRIIFFCSCGWLILLTGAQAQYEFPLTAHSTNTPVGLLSQYIRHPSVTGEEGTAGAFLADWCRAQGLHIRHFSQADSSYNFAASLYPLTDSLPNIVLMHHIDVVPPGPEDRWAYPPFSGAIVDDTVWGRGAIDCKGLGVMQAFAMLEFVGAARRRVLPYNVTLLAVSNEEVGGHYGSRIITDEYLGELNPVVVFGEGGGGMTGAVPSRPEVQVFGLSVAEKSNLWLRMQLKFATYGHGAAPPAQYVNKSMLKSLYKLNNRKPKIRFSETTRRMFREVGELEGGVMGFVMKHIHWPIFRPLLRRHLAQNPLHEALVTNTVTLTNISNPPGPPNVISSAATVYVDCRLLPNTNRKRFIRDLRMGLFEPRFEVEVLDEAPEAPPTQPDAFFDVMAAAVNSIYPDARVVPILFPASTDNDYYRSQGIPTYGFFPFLLSSEMMASVHNLNERIGVADLHTGIRIYREMLERVLRVGTADAIEVDNK